jgi:hypothetical protein
MRLAGNKLLGLIISASFIPAVIFHSIELGLILLILGVLESTADWIEIVFIGLYELYIYLFKGAEK